MSQVALLIFFAVVFRAISASAETTCESHRRIAGSSGHGLAWDIQCDADGNYLPLLCTKDAKEKNIWCACYNKEGVVTSSSKKIRFCDCPLAADAARVNGNSECDIPKCQNTGKFAEKQCCPATGLCHCVDPTTGQKKTQDTADPNLMCP